MWLVIGNICFFVILVPSGRQRDLQQGLNGLGGTIVVCIMSRETCQKQVKGGRRACMIFEMHICLHPTALGFFRCRAWLHTLGPLADKDHALMAHIRPYILAQHPLSLSINRLRGSVVA